MKITLDRALLEQAIKSIDKAFDFDGDVFGRMHNDTTDVLQALRAALANAEQAQPVPQSEIAQSFSEYWLTIISEDPSYQEVFEAGWKAGYKHGAWSDTPTGEQK